MTNQEALVRGLLERQKPSELEETQIPEITILKNVPQDPIYHPEGNAYIHSMEVLDRAAEIRSTISSKDRLVYMLAAWLHDIGKDSHTFYRGKSSKSLVHWKKKRPEGTRIVSYGHDSAGAKMTKTILTRELPELSLESAQQVEGLIANHMKPLLLKESGLKAFKKLQENGVELYLVGMLSWADKGEYPGYWFERIEELNEEKKRTGK